MFAKARLTTLSHPKVMKMETLLYYDGTLCIHNSCTLGGISYKNISQRKKAK